jgi:hypothetical protein
MRMRISYANVAATLALVFSMSGGAVAASHYLINSTKQINPKLVKKLKGAKGPTGPTGATGAAGAPGTAGKEGPGGKEGPPGKEGKTGEPGSAIGYAAVSAEGTLDTARSKGVVSVTHPVEGLYCFQLAFTPHVAASVPMHIIGNFTTFAESNVGKTDVAATNGTCKAPNDDASVVIADGSLINDNFYITFN